MSRKLAVQQFLSLDGVMQAPGAKDEDTRGGFPFGGWQLPYSDEAVVRFILERFSASDALLLGRYTYEIFAAYWPKVTDEEGNPFAAEMNRLVKYVVTDQTVDLTWQNSFQITGDAVEEIKKLKEQSGKDITVLGSGVLVQSLMRHHLIDEYALMVVPLILGEGMRRPGRSGTAAD